MNLLIVDDELIIREGLSQGIEWSAIDITLLPPADSAEAALKQAAETLPDILITDISMPGKNGIQLIEEMKKLNPKLKSVILTGYDEFKYAQEALHLHTSRYLLKPISPDALLKTISEIKEELIAENNKENEYRLLQKKFKENFQYFKEFFLRCLLEQKYSSGKNIQNEMELFNIASDKNIFFVALLEINWTSSDETEKYIQAIELMELIRSMQSDYTEIHTVHIADTQYALIFCSSDEVCLDIIYALHKDIYHSLNLENNIGLSNFYSDFCNLSLAYKEACEAASYRFIMGTNSIISINDILPESNTILQFPQEEFDNLITAQKNQNTSAFDRLISALYSKIRSYKMSTIQYAKQLTIEFLSVAARTAEQDGMAVQAEDSVEIWKSALSAKTIDDLEELMKSVYRVIADKLPVEDKNLIVKEISEYIKENYNHKINLTEIAKKFYLSYSYLSLLFKKETGSNITEYLNIVRINKAKELLKDPKNKIYNIGSMVGIDDSHYFSRIFKKYTGLSPSQYRNTL